MFLLRTFMGRIIRRGRLVVIDHRGARREYIGAMDGVDAAIRLHDAHVGREIALNPRLKVGEAYMDGRLTIPEGHTLSDFLTLAIQNMAFLNQQRSRVQVFLLNMIHWMAQHNPVGKAQRNIAHHYDLSDELFDLFLDPSRQYSCGYFHTPSDTLEQAQRQKMRHIAAKLALKPGQKILDIGCGWGGLAIYLAEQEDVEITGVTLSVEQHAGAVKRAAEAGLSDRITFRLQDYRLVEEKFDRIVSVGMFEHVGKRHYGEFFAKLGKLLTEDGIALIHTIGNTGMPGPVATWMRKYIFPGGYLPSLSEIATHMERQGLWLTDLESLRTHYAETLKAWHTRFQAQRAHVRDNLYDERFCRMWEFYLLSSEVNFRENYLTVFQMQITRNIDAAPYTRDYMFDWERAHAEVDD